VTFAVGRSSSSGAELVVVVALGVLVVLLLAHKR
jgi:hypothetical protein